MVAVDRDMPREAAAPALSGARRPGPFWACVGRPLLLGLAVFGLGLEATGFGTAGLLGIFCFAVLLGGIVVMFAGVVRGRPRTLAVGLGYIGAPVLGGFASIAVAGRQVETSLERGEQLAAAIEDHRTRTGVYPDGLRELVPDELDQVPATALGLLRTIPFGYLGQGDRFSLSFVAPGWILWQRRSDGTWVSD